MSVRSELQDDVGAAEGQPVVSVPKVLPSRWLLGVVAVTSAWAGLMGLMG